MGVRAREPRVQRSPHGTNTGAAHPAQVHQRLLGEYDDLARGEKGAWLRQKGLYGAQLADWRKTLSEQGTQGLEPKTGGRKAKDPRDRRIEALEREKARLEHRARVAEDMVDLQKKFFTLVEDAQNGNSR